MNTVPDNVERLRTDAVFAEELRRDMAKPVDTTQDVLRPWNDEQKLSYSGK